MSRRGNVAVSSPVSEETSELETFKSLQEDQEGFRQKADVERICKAESTLQLTECDQDVEDELLEASLEEYQ
jgi:hypothetical protein